jgi:hypothetical protein
MPNSDHANHEISDIAQHRVFIAYSRKDIQRVEDLADRLSARGIRVLRDVTDILVFEDWWRQLEKMILAADTIIFAISPDAMASRICVQEVEYATRLNKRILPVLLSPVRDDIIPAQLARLQYLVFTDKADVAAFETLVAAILAGARYGQGAQGDTIFLSYRRDEDAHVAGRIFDHLEREFGEGRIFFDVEGIPLGTDFRNHIRTVILKSQALVAVIGRKWASRFRNYWSLPGSFRSIDYVRTEIELALEHNVRILPLLVDGAKMPNEQSLPSQISQICYFQAAPIRAGLDFRIDIGRVLDAIKNPPRHAVV